jgi:hypothetical protein
VKYLDSMSKLRGIRFDKIYPGHGPVCISVGDKIEEQLENRQRREMQVLEALRESEDGASVARLVEIIYKDIDPKLVMFASK